MRTRPAGWAKRDVAKEHEAAEKLSPTVLVKNMPHGSLNNQPVSTDELQIGALVSFGPEHIIQIYDDE